MPNYKEEQKAAKKSKNRGWIISTDGTYTCRSIQQRIRGKAAIKAAKKLTHRHNHYRSHRAWAAEVKRVEASIGMKLVN